jgi:hypothetical protein
MPDARAKGGFGGDLRLFHCPVYEAIIYEIRQGYAPVYPYFSGHRLLLIEKSIFPVLRGVQKEGKYYV